MLMSWEADLATTALDGAEPIDELRVGGAISFGEVAERLLERLVLARETPAEGGADGQADDESGQHLAAPTNVSSHVARGLNRKAHQQQSQPAHAVSPSVRGSQSSLAGEKNCARTQGTRAGAKATTRDEPRLELVVM